MHCHDVADHRHLSRRSLRALAGAAVNKLLIGLDVESTGLDWLKGDRIIEFAGVGYRWSDRAQVFEYEQRINNEGRRFDAKAQEVHGISPTDLIGCPAFKAETPRIHKMLNLSAAVVTFNGEHFDLPFIDHELKGAGLNMPTHLVSYDLMKLGMFASYDAKPPTLADLCWALGVHYDHEQAHQALYDVRVMLQCFWIMVDRGLIDVSQMSVAA